MADLLLVHLALIPGPMRKERQFSLANDFPGLDFTIPSRTIHSAYGFPALFQVFTRTDRAVRASANFLHNIFALRWKRRRLLAAVM